MGTNDLEIKTDMDIVLSLVRHIENPCTVEVKGRTENIQDFYLRESRKILPTLTNSYARNLLESVIESYS